MKKFGVYSVLTVSAFGFLLGLSPLKAHAGLITTDTLTFKNTGGNSLGGYSTYPYYFNIKTAAGTTTTGVPLLCVSFQDTIQPTESWQADVYTVGSTYLNTDTKNSLVPVLNTAQQDADTWIYRAGSANSDRGISGGSVLWQPKMAEKRRTDEQTSAQEPHSGVQGEGGLGRNQR
jgi:hypothetical protein